MTIARDAIQQFYVQEGLPVDGGATKWVDTIQFYGLLLPIPNPQVRVDVLPYHDLHHVVTGYATDEAGEGEISAWTVGTGGGSAFGHLYDLGGFLIGLTVAPRRTIKAFFRGRQCTNLYRRPAEEWMGWEVEAIRRHIGADRPLETVTAMDRFALVREIASAILVWSAVSLLPLAMLGVVAGAIF